MNLGKRWRVRVMNIDYIKYIPYLIAATLMNATGLWIVLTYILEGRLHQLQLTWWECFVVAILINIGSNVYNIKDYKKP